MVRCLRLLHALALVGHARSVADERSQQAPLTTLAPADVKAAGHHHGEHSVPYGAMKTPPWGATDFVELYPGIPVGKMPGGSDDRRRPDDSSCTERTGNCVPYLSTYLAENPPPKGAPAVVLFPGGGLNTVDIEIGRVAQRFQASNISAFVVMYRVPDNIPSEATSSEIQLYKTLPGWTPLIDAQRAMSIVHSRAHEWKIDQSNIGITGLSAGGGVAIELSQAWGQRRYDRIDNADLAPPAKPAWMALLYPAACIDPAHHEIPGNWCGMQDVNGSLKLAIDMPVPPTWIAQSKNDKVVPYEGTQRLANAMSKVSNAKVLTTFYKDGEHAFAPRCTCHGEIFDCDFWFENLLGFLSKQKILGEHSRPTPCCDEETRRAAHAELSS
jgi:acetyl esterase/lipase